MTAPYDVNICIDGESGTGKELVANQIHLLSPRRNHSFVTINCGAIPETLVESEFFGYEKGAFTGAYYRKPGKFELADKGTFSGRDIRPKSSCASGIVTSDPARRDNNYWWSETSPDQCTYSRSIQSEPGEFGRTK